MRPSRSRRRTPLLVLCAALGSTAVALPSPAVAMTAEPECDAPVASETQEGYTIFDPDCDIDGSAFPALPDATLYTGIDDGQAYRIEVPDGWNGDLVVYAHGFRGNGLTVYVDAPQLRQHFLDKGYAWAASSYQTNGYDVEQGVEDSHDMVARFEEVVPAEFGELDEVIIHGPSMGGHITAVVAERHEETFAAAYPVCGVLGDVELFDYFVDANVTAAAATDTEIGYEEYAPPAEPSVYGDLVAEEIAPELFSERPQLAAPGERWSEAVEQRSGGERPGFASSFAFWNSFGFAPLEEVPFLFGVYPGLSAGTIGIADGNVAGNAATVYQLDDDPALSEAEKDFNAEVLRVEEDPDASGIPPVAGTTPLPILSLHGLGDLFVPFSMEQIYAQEAAVNGVDFVSRAIRSTAHCDFTDGELAKGFDDLVLWTVTGLPPAGDDVLDPEAVAQDTFGCRFTQEARQAFVAPACPTLPDIEGSVHETAIESLLAGGIVNGLQDGSFGPGVPVNRGQVASLLARALELTPQRGGASFNDIDGSVHEEAIKALADAGIARGFDDGSFRPGVEVTRGQLASFVGRALGAESTEDGCFGDVPDNVHSSRICALASLGILGGFADGSFKPNQAINRAQTAAVVYRAFG